MTGKSDLKLRPVDISNFRDVGHLKVGKKQAKFLWSGGSPVVNWQFLVDCAYIPDCEPRAAYVKDKLVGLIGWCRHHPDGCFLEPAIPGAYAIDHVMIAKRHQGKGFGRKMIAAAIAELSMRADCRRVVLSVDPDNKDAIKLYKRSGFRTYHCGDEGDDIWMEYKWHE